MNKNNKQKINTKNYVKWAERISYAAIDFACCAGLALITSFLMYFYTDVFGLSAAAVGTLFLVAKIVCAPAGPFWGIMVDHTNTKWGKSRPYWLWFSIPYGIFGAFVFFTPDLSIEGKLIYAYITYIGVNFFSSSVYVPVCSILPNLTPSLRERVTLGTIKQIFGTLGSTLIVVFALPMVNAFGHGDQQTGFFITATIVSVLGVLLLLNAFVRTNERVQSNSSRKSISFRDSIRALKGNTPWLIITVVNFVIWIGTQTRNQVTVYFFKYNMNAEWLTSIMLGLGLFTLVTAALIPVVSRFIGKRNTMLAGMLISIVGQLCMYIGSLTLSVELIIAANIIVNLGNGFVAGLIPPMLADCVDYGEWKNGVRAEGVITSFSSFATVIGMGLGGAITGFILSIGGYVANEAQSASALQAISANYVWVPMIGFVLAAILLLFYRVDKIEDKMQIDLLRKHSHNVNV